MLRGFWKPLWVTFTGLDERTDLDHVLALSVKYPVEWGVLFSRKRQGNDPRYPNQETIDRIVALKRQQPVIRLAAHICGAYAEEIMDGDFTKHPDLNAFSRAQVNHVAPDLEVLDRFSEHLSPSPHAVIAQTRGAFPEGNDRVCWLYDPSGGRGTVSTAWPEFTRTREIVGFAGGIGPDNVHDVVEAIGSRSGQGAYWIDMESRVRTDDWLDLDKCESVLNTVYG